jgi:hypothetical protein
LLMKSYARCPQLRSFTEYGERCGHIKFFAAFAERSLEGKDAVSVLLGTRTNPLRVPPQSLISSPSVVLLGTFAEEISMDSAERCRINLEECLRLMPLAKSPAEATVLKNLVRSWKMIANQIALYEEIMADQK